jgi:hypothetical protein
LEARKGIQENTLAKSIVDRATGEKPKVKKTVPPGISNRARAAALTPEERKAIARKAAAARWHKGHE